MSATRKRAATPPPPAPVKFTVRLPGELHAELAAAADERNVSAARLVELAVRDYLPRLIPADELTYVRPALNVGDDLRTLRVEP